MTTDRACRHGFVHCGECDAPAKVDAEPRPTKRLILSSRRGVISGAEMDAGELVKSIEKGSLRLLEDGRQEEYLLSGAVADARATCWDAWGLPIFAQDRNVDAPPVEDAAWDSSFLGTDLPKRPCLELPPGACVMDDGTGHVSLKLGPGSFETRLAPNPEFIKALEASMEPARPSSHFAPVVYDDSFGGTVWEDCRLCGDYHSVRVTGKGTARVAHVDAEKMVIDMREAAPFVALFGCTCRPNWGIWVDGELVVGEENVFDWVKAGGIALGVLLQHSDGSMVVLNAAGAERGESVVLRGPWRGKTRA